MIYLFRVLMMIYLFKKQLHNITNITLHKRKKSKLQPIFDPTIWVLQKCTPFSQKLNFSTQKNENHLINFEWWSESINLVDCGFSSKPLLALRSEEEKISLNMGQCYSEDFASPLSLALKTFAQIPGPRATIVFTCLENVKMKMIAVPNLFEIFFRRFVNTVT